MYCIVFEYLSIFQRSQDIVDVKILLIHLYLGMQRNLHFLHPNQVVNVTKTRLQVVRVG